MRQTEQNDASRPAPNVQDYTELAASYDAKRYIEHTHLSHERRRRLVLRELLPTGRARHAVDIACGTGRGLAVLRDSADSVVGVDGTLAMLGAAKQKFAGSIPLIQANAAQLPFSDGTFDLVISLNFVHLFPLTDKGLFITEMGRVLKQGGTLIVEFDNAMQGVVLGAVRKYAGRDIGYDWPWQIRAAFRRDMFEISQLAGANLPFVWRIPALRQLDNYTARFPLNYLATRIMVRAVRK